MANALRFLAIDAVEAAASGHPGLPMGLADVATVLFRDVMTYDPGNPTWPDRDRFVLSGGHGSMLLYACLHLTGYAGMSLDEIKRFRQLGSVANGHPEVNPELGIETTTGPLGQGVANAVGMALAERLLNARFGDDLVDHRTWVTCGDGDLMEGISHEAASFAGHLRLSKLTVFHDDNHISIDGSTDLAQTEDVVSRFNAYGWNTRRIDGHDPEAILAAARWAMTSDRPTFISCRTTIGYGSPGKAGTAAAHGAPLGAKEVQATRAALGWSYPPFEVPDDIRARWAEAGGRGRTDQKAWQARFDAASADLQARFKEAMAGDLPALDALFEAFAKDMLEKRPAMATRAASGAVLDRLGESFASIVGGSADLTPSNNTRFKTAKDVSPGMFDGNYVHYGVREFGMGAVMNGMALHGGVIPYGGTFLVFSDYARPAIRMAALMGLRVIHVGTHDSIGLGEDGPTHQPVEHLAALRAIPGLQVFRPADVIETAEAWQIALESPRTPTVLALSRQALPTLRPAGRTGNVSRDGAYVLFPAGTSPHKVTLLASGSEVAIASDARDVLESRGIGVSLVSVPCLTRFLEMPVKERNAILGEGTVRVVVEAATRLGWDALLDEGDLFIGMHGFGASAPADDLYRHFGITVEAIVAAVDARLGC